MEKKILDFIQQNSPDGGFLQSEYWKKFQESVGRKTFNISEADENGEQIAYANIISHKLPVVGKYFYVPRGPVIETKSAKRKAQNNNSKLKTFFSESIGLAKKNNIGWTRIEPANDEILQAIKENLPGGVKMKKSSVDMQPREILAFDISEGEEEILAGMKQKTRYNVKLAEKKGVNVTCNTQHVTQNNIDQFIKLVKITADRDKITSHPENYYRKMFKVIPPDILKLYVAEYGEKIIAANLVLFFGKTATYMHGASDNMHRDAMAPYLLQWQAIKDAKKTGCEKYDLGGVKIPDTKYKIQNTKSWSGITKFKTGFVPGVEPIQFPGCYDIILKPVKYNLYRALQKVKRIF